MAKSEYRVITVMDPVMCLRCERACIAEILFTDGSIRMMLYCNRLDCDNWTGDVYRLNADKIDQ